MLVVFYTTFAFVRPVLLIQPVLDIEAPKTGASTILPWPNYGQAALGAEGFGLLATHGKQTAVAAASTTKIITALAILDKKPLRAGQQGPVISLGASDVAIYQKYLRQGGSVAKVADGEKLSQYQALQAMLLPSANNIADSLVIWAFGSQKAFLSYVDDYTASIGLKNTHLADASGFSPKSTSTAEDLVTAGLRAMQNPVIAEIVAQKQATIPVAGVIQNVNWLLGKGGIVGIKTGHTDEAGGCYLLASRMNIAGERVMVVGAIMNAPNLQQAIVDADRLAKASKAGFKSVELVKAGQVVGRYSSPWGEISQIIAARGESGLIWRGFTVSVKPNLAKIAAPIANGVNVGSIDFGLGNKTISVLAKTSNIVSRPSPIWRLTHPIR